MSVQPTLELATPSDLRPATRTSTLASALDDKGGLNAYEAATTLHTVASTPTLLTRLALVGSDNWRDYKPLHIEAQKRRGKPEAEAGTNIHATVEALLNGQSLSGVDIGTIHSARLVLTTLREAGLHPVGVEEFVVTLGLPELVAGTRDLLCQKDGSEALVVVDIKTTSTIGNARLKATSWAIQTAVYANGLPYTEAFTRDSFGRPKIDRWLVGEESRLIDKERAYIVEVGRDDGEAAIHTLDIVRGLELARLACEVRLARKHPPLI